MRAKFVEVLIFSVIVMQFGIFAVSGSNYATKPKGVVLASLTTSTAVNEKLGLELTVQLEKAEYLLGEPVHITFTLTNISNQTIDMAISATCFDFLVLNDTGKVIFQYSTSQAFPMYMLGVNLAPGQNLTCVEVWPQTYYETGGTAVPSGTYYIVGLFGAELLPSGNTVTLQTSPLQITVGPDPLRVVGFTHCLMMQASSDGGFCPRSGRLAIPV